MCSFKDCKKDYERVIKYFSVHVHYNAFVHVLAGIGWGILITYPLIGSHPVRWGVFFLVIAILGHLYPLTAKK